MSRTKARKQWHGKQLQRDLEARGIYVRSTSWAGLAEEAGGAYKDIDEVIHLANTTMYGLAAGVWTRDITKAHAIANNVRAGTVWVNCYHVFDTAAPFGGFKQSGMGRELGEYCLENYTEVKTVTIQL